MKWSDYVAQVVRKDGQESKPFIVRAVSCKHALRKVTVMFEAVETTSMEVIKCRCSEINNDMCEAHYLYWFNR